MARVRVPYIGEFSVSLTGEPATVYTVRRGVVEVNDADVSAFLVAIPGSEVAAAAAAPATTAGTTGKDA